MQPTPTAGSWHAARKRRGQLWLRTRDGRFLRVRRNLAAHAQTGRHGSSGPGIRPITSWVRLQAGSSTVCQCPMGRPSCRSASIFDKLARTSAGALEAGGVVITGPQPLNARRGRGSSRVARVLHQECVPGPAEQHGRVQISDPTGAKELKRPGKASFLRNTAISRSGSPMPKSIKPTWLALAGSGMAVGDGKNFPNEARPSRDDPSAAARHPC